ncbi:type II toxin-antitoxin system YafQ family toxin [Candidatus Ruthia endofausta]|nr:type II toxin-antitoxin system YafQ family toxin [Candidatus Ruthia endofausta]
MPIKPDLLLVYQTSFVELKLIRIGSHSELF